MSEIALSRVAPFPGASVTAHSGAILIVTDPRPWAHSAEAEFGLPEIGDKPQKIIVALKVESGALGIGWLRQDGLAWVKHVIARSGKARHLLEIPAGTVGGKLVFNNQRDDGQPREDCEHHYRAALAAEERGNKEAAIALYKAMLHDDPAHVGAIAGLGRMRYVDPPQPVLDEMRRWRPADAVFHAMIEIRNPCNYRCFYCILAGSNNTPVQRFDLDRIEQVYRQIRARMIITSFECGGGEPTVHPQFPELLRICSKYGGVSFPTNNSQNPKRWLPLETAKRIHVRSALHPEAEEDLDRYCENARYLMDAGCRFDSVFIAHPTRLSKYTQFREYFQQRNVPFGPYPFNGDYNGKTYPQSYTEAEKEMICLNDPDTHWISRVNPHVTRIRNFRGIPCTAGYRSVYIKSDGTVLRCAYDQERVLDGLLAKPEICGVSNCGCMLQLEKLDQVEVDADYWMSMFGQVLDLDQSAYDWFPPMQHNRDRLIAENGYEGLNEALAVEARRVYDALMAAYGKDEFPEQ